ncbi:MAG: GHKL domain-containing protein [Ruminiclostridium sp.]|nr:GHKL domain-containing protein [Ruminiclostridium sp.]
MTILIIAVIVLLIICISLVLRLISIRRSMREIKNELILTRDEGYNRQLTVELSDSVLEEMTAEMNRNLDYQKKLKEESGKAERILKQSVSDIAHDLRTPLTVIKGNLQMIALEDGLSEKSRGYLAASSEKCSEMKRMADDFFELSLLESDSSPVKLSKVNITNLLMQFLADSEAVIRGKELVPDVVFPERTVFALADEDLVRRMLGNLLNNVLKYAVEGFCITLSVSENECGIVFSNAVKKGTEIDAEKLFERTYRADKARSGNGAGLGLYIVKLLAQKQNGRVTAECKDNELFVSVYLKTGGK